MEHFLQCKQEKSDEKKCVSFEDGTFEWRMISVPHKVLTSRSDVDNEKRIEKPVTQMFARKNGNNIKKWRLNNFSLFWFGNVRNPILWTWAWLNVKMEANSLESCVRFCNVDWHIERSSGLFWWEWLNNACSACKYCIRFYHTAKH